MQIKISSNLQLAIKKLEKLNSVMNAAAAETLRNVASQVGREAARQIRSTKYAPKLTISEILKARTTQDGGRFSPPNGAMVWKEKGPKNTTPAKSQEAIVNISTSSIPLIFFNPRDTKVPTKYGPRYGVIVTVFGKRVVTGGFHLKGRGSSLKHGSPNGNGTYNRDSKVFKRTDSGIEMYKFISPGRLLDNFGKLDHLENYGRKIFSERFARNFDRYSRLALK